MAFTARHTGRCANCPDGIEPGDRVAYQVINGRDQVAHVDCDDPRAGVPATGPRPPTDRAVCPRCHLVTPCWCQ